MSEYYSLHSKHCKMLLPCVWSAALCPECLAFNKHREPRTQNDQKCAQEDLLIVWPALSRSPASPEFPHNRTMDGLNYTRCLHTGLQIESIAFVHLQMLWRSPCMQTLWWPPQQSLKRRFSEDSKRFHNHREDPYQGLLWLKAPTSAFTFKTLCKQVLVLTPR